MARAWASLILLGVLASQVDGYGKKSLPYPWNVYFWLIFVAVIFIIPCCICCCCAFNSIAREGEKEETRVALTRNPSWERHQWNARLSTINENKQGSSLEKSTVKETKSGPTVEKKIGGGKEESVLPRGKVTVQLVDEQLVDLEVPPAELTVTSFSKLLSDLTFYSGQPDIQGLLVKSDSGGFVQVFDMDRIPRGSLKVRTAISGDKHFVQLYPNPKLGE